MNTSTRTYDALNRPVTDKDGANRTITSAYDTVGRKTSYTDAKQATFSFQFDALGRLTRRTEPDTTYQTYSYDAANRLLVHRIKRVGPGKRALSFLVPEWLSSGQQVRN